MRLKGYLRGLGAGIFISAVLMGIATSGKDSMSDEEIKKRAAALGMVEEDEVLLKPSLEETIPKLPDDTDTESKADVKDPSAEEDKNTENTDNDDTEKTGTVKDVNSDTPDKDEKFGEMNEPDEKSGPEKTDEDIKAKEDRAMGGQNDMASEAKHEDNTDNNAADVSDGDKPDADTKPAKQDDNNSFTLQIASGTTSYSVAQLLQKGGVIEDAADFDNFLCGHHYDKRINHGVFKIPAGAGYDEIAEIITGIKRD